MNIVGIWIVSICGFLFSIINFLLGKYIATKITNNDLVHLTKDVDELKKEEKDYKKALNSQLHKVFLKLNKIEREIVKRSAICNERHKR